MEKATIGIDIGGTNTVFGLVSENGKCFAKNSIRTDTFENADDFVVDLCKNLKLLIVDFNNFQVKGIGIGAPNGNYYKGTIENAPNLKWKGVIHLADLIKKEMDLPVILTNDANAAALGEKIYGGAKQMKNFVLITLGTGLGSGFVINGELLYGHDGFAGEAGHTIAVPDGRLCGCGRKGCLETYCSATGIKTTVIEMMSDNKYESILKNIKPEDITSRMIYDAALKGDKLAIEAFNFTSRLLGSKLADIVAITSPEAIFLFGGLAQAKEFIYDSTKKYLEESLLNIFRNKVQILPSQLPENDAAILGAAALIS